MPSLLPLACALALLVAPAAHAEPDALPSTLSGRWTYVPAGGRTIVDAWSIRFDGAGTPGQVSGRLTWRGVSCGAQDEPVAGTWDGKELRFEGLLKPNVNVQNANGRCGAGRALWVLARKPGGAFEGEASMNDRQVVVSVTAAP